MDKEQQPPSREGLLPGWRSDCKAWWSCSRLSEEVGAGAAEGVVLPLKHGGQIHHGWRMMSLAPNTEGESGTHTHTQPSQTSSQKSFRVEKQTEGSVWVEDRWGDD